MGQRILSIPTGKKGVGRSWYCLSRLVLRIQVVEGKDSIGAVYRAMHVSIQGNAREFSTGGIRGFNRKRSWDKGYFSDTPVSRSVAHST